MSQDSKVLTVSKLNLYAGLRSAVDTSKFPLNLRDELVIGWQPIDGGQVRCAQPPCGFVLVEVKRLGE